MPTRAGIDEAHAEHVLHCRQNALERILAG